MKHRTIKKIQNILDEYIKATKNFYRLLETIEDKKIKKILVKHAFLYGALNINLALYMMKIIPYVTKQKAMDIEFEKLMRQLKNGK